MPTPIPQNYLETEVLTAPPQKLRLMLIQATIRAVERTRLHWRNGENEKACDTLIRAQEIVTELLAGINREAAPELTGKVASIYVFIFRSLIDASLHHNEAKLDDAVRVLREEEETWRQVCEKLLAAGSGVGTETFSPTGFNSPQTPVPHPLANLEIADEGSAGFSLEA